MKVIGLESISGDIQSEGYFVKCILTQEVAVFFPGSTQHRDVKHPGVSYEDDYLGNALAATITPGVIDIRFHRDYPDDRVGEIVAALLKLSGMEWAASFMVRYQGRILLP